MKKKQHSVRHTLHSAPRGKTDWKKLRAMTNEEVEAAAWDDLDHPPTTKAFWKNAVIVAHVPR